MKTRVVSATIYVAILLVAIISRLFTPYVFDAIMLLAGVIGCVEVARAFSNNRKPINEATVVSMVFMLYIGLMYIVFNQGTLLQLLLYVGILIVVYFVFTFLVNICYKESTNNEIIKSCYVGSIARFSLAKAFRTILVFVYPAILFAIMIVLNHLDSFYALTVVEESKITTISIFVDFIIISSVVCATFTDTFAMLIGCKLRGPKLCPKISPNKTISGAISGWLFGVIGILGVYMLYSLNADFISIIEELQVTWLPIIIYAVFAPILEQIGDIVASLVKRKNNIKDYGNIFPGHGGVMDRVDGLLFVGLVSFIISIIICL